MYINSDNVVNGYVTTVGNLMIVQSVDVAIKQVASVNDTYECLAFVAGQTLAHVTGFSENKIVESQYITDSFEDLAMGEIVSGGKLVLPRYCVLGEIACF